MRMDHRQIAPGQGARSISPSGRCLVFQCNLPSLAASIGIKGGLENLLPGLDIGGSLVQHTGGFNDDQHQGNTYLDNLPQLLCLVIDFID